MKSPLERILHFPVGFSKVKYMGSMYGVTRTDFNNGKSIKLYAEDLSGTNFISFNYYKGLKEALKPCEMPADKVYHFLKNYVNITS
ncbi:MAG: peptide methionine sulfoxide reductase [Flavobacteriaceae bacterium]|nr:peptide methionine sulfoxide reductase [Flavobacteriaceae bacterium]